MEQKGQNSNDSTNKKNEFMEKIRRALPKFLIISGILIIVWWINSWLVIDSMSQSMCYAVMAPGVVGLILIIIGIATNISQRIDISGIVDKAKHNKRIILRVIFVLILLLFIRWGIKGNPLSSGHFLLQYNLGRRGFRGIDCNECDLSGTNLEEANFNYAKLREANISGADLSYAAIGWADLSGADLKYADLSGADLEYTDLSGAELDYADLSGAYLGYANLSGARLSGANLRNTDLRWADLSGADLSGADLSSANLNSADLSGADLSGAKLLISEFNNVYHLYCTTMPDGMTYDGHLNLNGDLYVAEKERKIDINDDEAMAEFYCISLEEYIRGQERNGSD